MRRVTGWKLDGTNIRLFANDQAIRYFERALAALMKLPSSERIERLELAIQQAYLPALMAVVGFAAQKTFKETDRALELCKKLGIAGATLPVLFSQFSYQMACAGLTPAFKSASRLAQLGDDADDNVGRLVGHRALGLCHLLMGNLEVAENALKTALSLGETVDHQRVAFELGHDPIVTAYAFYSIVKLKRGFPEQGHQLLVAATDRARKSGHSLTLGYVLQQQLFFNVLAEDYAELERASTVLQQTGERQHMPQYRPFSGFFHRWALGRLGERVDLDDLEQLLAEHRQGASFALWNPLLMMMLADVYANNDDVVTAERWLDEGLATIARTAEELFLPEIYLMKAKLAETGTDNCADRDRWLLASMEAAIKQSAKLSELRTATMIAKSSRAEFSKHQPCLLRFTDGSPKG